MNYTVDIRPRRQVTIPNAILNQLGVGIGDSLEIEIQGKEAIVKPKKQVALDALKEIQRAFRNSKIPMSAFVNDAEEQRLEVAKSFPDK